MVCLIFQVLDFAANSNTIPSRLSGCRLQHSLTFGLMDLIIWPSKAHRGATRPANWRQMVFVTEFALAQATAFEF
jgi:hypothetical protein